MEYVNSVLGNTNLWNDLGFSLCAMLFVCHMVTTSDEKMKSEIEVSTDWYVTIEYIFMNYQTSELQCNYLSYIQVDNIGDAQSFSGIAPIALSGGFSSKTLTRVRRTLPWKTELDRSIPIIEDRIFRLLHHCYKDML